MIICHPTLKIFTITSNKNQLILYTNNITVIEIDMIVVHVKRNKYIFLYKLIIAFVCYLYFYVLIKYVLLVYSRKAQNSLSDILKHLSVYQFSNTILKLIFDLNCDENKPKRDLFFFFWFLLSKKLIFLFRWTGFVRLLSTFKNNKKKNSSCQVLNLFRVLFIYCEHIFDLKKKNKFPFVKLRCKCI